MKNRLGCVLFVALFFLTGLGVGRLSVVENTRIKNLEQMVAEKCLEADRSYAAFEKKFPKNKDATKNSHALESEEWKTSSEWAQACDETQALLVEALKENRK